MTFQGTQEPVWMPPEVEPELAEPATPPFARPAGPRAPAAPAARHDVPPRPVASAAKDQPVTEAAEGKPTPPPDQAERNREQDPPA